MSLRKLHWRAALTLLLLAFGAVHPAQAIINGKLVIGDEAYAHAVVGVVPVNQYGRPGTCTGILIAPRAVLTAAHCVSGDDITGVSVVFDLTIGEANYVAVTRTVVNPDYKDVDGEFNIGDLAVVFLAEHDYPTAIIPFDASEDFGDGQQFVFVGYGRAIYNRSRSAGTARKASIAAIGHDTPREVPLKPLMDAWPCGGDSGGPIMRKDMSGRYSLSGILSSVYIGPVGECLFENSFMTPVHTYREWIADTLAKGG